MLRKILPIIFLALLGTALPCPLQANSSPSATVSVLPEEPPVGTTAYYELNIRDHFKKGDWAGAKPLLDEAIKKYPQMSAFHELMGRYYLNQAEAATGKNATALYDKARYYLIRSISIDEKNVQSRYYMLRLETETKHYSSAIVYCNDLLEENPYNEELWRKKIDLYRKLGNNAEADRLLERIFAIYSGDDQLRKDLVERKTVLAKRQRENGDWQGQEQTVRQLVELEPKNAEAQHALVNILYRSGRTAEAAEAAAQAAAETGQTTFVEKRAGMLCEMNRSREAVEYVKGYMARTGNKSLTSLLNDMEEEAARAAQYNDAYTSYAKIYDSQHSLEALDYLVNTSIQRWYLDDAAIYIEESLKRRGETPKMLYNQYLVQKRLGNNRKANTLLENLYSRYPDNEDIAEEMMLYLIDSAKEMMDQHLYAEAVPVLERVYNSNAYPYLRESAEQRLYNCYFQTKQYAKAEKLLEQMDGVRRISQTAMLYSAWGKQKQALNFLAEAYNECPHDDIDTRNLISYSYEEISLPFIKNLIAAGRIAEAGKQAKEAIEICPDNVDLLRYGITTAQRRGDETALAQYVYRGRTLYPNDPYFILKDAQQRHLAGDHKASLEEIVPLLQEYAGDSLLVALYVESNIEMAKEFMTAKQPDEALLVVNAALEVDPENSELYYVQGQAYEQKKEWKLAYESYRKYKPGYAELAEHRHHLESLFHHTLRNSVSLEYQQARLGSEDAITGNAFINYTRVCNKRTAINAGLTYAGRDGSTSSGNALTNAISQEITKIEQGVTKTEQNETDIPAETDMTRGGTGVQLSFGLEHAFTHRFTGKIEVSAATRYFPLVMGRLSCTFDMKKDWQLTALACYRMVHSYQGIYNWQKFISNYENGRAIVDSLYARTGWEESKKSMAQVGIGLNKTINKFVLGGEISGLYISDAPRSSKDTDVSPKVTDVATETEGSNKVQQKKWYKGNLYFNANLKMTFFPQDGNSSHIFAVGGFGTAPESSLIDRSLPVSFNKLNTFVGMGGTYFVNRHLSLNLSGTWYTMLSQAEQLTTTFVRNDPVVREDYRNYFYVHGSVLISF